MSKKVADAICVPKKVKKYPVGSVTAFDPEIKKWRVAAPKGSTITTGFKGAGGDTSKKYVELEQSASKPASPLVVTLEQYNQLLKGPWYKRPLVWVAAGGAVVIVGGGAWYFTLPLDAAWGLPSRRYYDPSDDEFEELQRSGELSPIELPNPSTGNLAFAESSDVWRERRKDAMRDRAVAGRSLFYLETFGPDVVFAQFDRADDEVKYAVIVQEIPAEDFGPDTDLAKLAGAAGGVDPEDLARFGLFADKDGSIIGGIAAGVAERTAETPSRREGLWTLSIFVTRTEVYYHVIPGITGAPKGSASARIAATTDGTIIWAARHGAMINGEPTCPLVPIPCMET
ncbi:hypothetical protein LCGC14_2894980 [marine sediment metagenome]|uniref:Uncharacterized protein n=1 Tax=marine sediment metagenome TaxID=412755 RepID=A0A0F9A3Y0_9ZZZZ